MQRFMLEGPVHDRLQSCFALDTLCMSYLTNTFLLVSSSVRSKQLLSFVQGQSQEKVNNDIVHLSGQ